MTAIESSSLIFFVTGLDISILKNSKLSISLLESLQQTDKVRAKQKKYTIERYNLMFPDAQIILVESPLKTKNEWEGFCKSKYINIGVKKATREYLLITDIDVVLPKESILRAIDKLKNYSCIIPYNILYKLNDRESMFIYEDLPKVTMPKPKLDRSIKIIVHDKRYQGVNIMKRSDFILSGGYDERFIGWGSEDAAFLKAIETITEKPVLRLNGTAYHLSHKINPNRQKLRDINSGVFVHEYDDAFGDKNKMLELIEKRGRNL